MSNGETTLQNKLQYQRLLVLQVQLDCVLFLVTSSGLFADAGMGGQGRISTSRANAAARASGGRAAPGSLMG
jgi:hypothetical protein